MDRSHLVSMMINKLNNIQQIKPCKQTSKGLLKVSEWDTLANTCIQLLSSSLYLNGSQGFSYGYH